ncbi:polyprotein [Frankliniella fusca]|uniref:Polyprotein n=1 Tax=Frankliniella fusca TaxID=407009 RepID=A0AAE1HKG2_9NEOP|nr:polyprotein [Frankliniella fusca]
MSVGVGSIGEGQRQRQRAQCTRAVPGPGPHAVPRPRDVEVGEARQRAAVRGEVLAQVGLPPEALVANRARDLGLGGVAVLAVVLRPLVGLRGVHLGLGGAAVTLPRLVPSPVGRQVGGAVEHFVALGAAVLDVHDARAPVLCKREGVVVELAAQAAHVVADLVLDGSKLRLGLLGHLHHVEGRIDVTLTNNERVTVLLHHLVDVPDDGAGHRRALVLVEGELAHRLGLLRRGAGGGLGAAGGRPPLGGRRDAGRHGALEAGRRIPAWRNVMVGDALIVVVDELELDWRQGGVDTEGVALAASGRGG